MSQLPNDDIGTKDLVSRRDIILESDSDQDGVGDIVLRTGGVERARINASGVGTGWSNVLGGSLPASGNTVMFAGDSITAHDVSGQGVLTQNELGPRTYSMWASILSQGRILWGGIAATVGYTTDQILATHIPTVVAAKPNACVVLAGTNDAHNGEALATTLANLQAIYTTLKAGGVTPVCCTLPPQGTSTTAQKKNITQINSWITRYAAANGYPVVDFYSQLVDATTGEWTSGLNTDDLHPNSAGAKIMGQAVSDVLCGTSFLTIRQAGPWLPPISPWLPAYNSDPSSLIANNLMLTLTGSRPSNWSLVSGTPGAEAAGTDATVLGNYYSLTGAASNPTLSCAASAATASAGDWMYVCARFGTASVVANSAAWTLKFYSVDSVQDYINLSTWDRDVPKGSVLAFKFQIPANDTSNKRVTARIYAQTAAGVISIGQVAILNLTTLGIA